MVVSAHLPGASGARSKEVVVRGFDDPGSLRASAGAG